MAADTEPVMPRLVAALDRVTRWREEQDSAAQARLREIQAERERLLTDIADLQRQVDELAGLEGGVKAQAEHLAVEERKRTRQAVFEGIEHDAGALVARDLLYNEAVKAREVRVAELLADPEIERLVHEFEQFQALEASLASFPAGYRDAMRAHHDGVRQRLEPVMQAAQAPLPQGKAEPLAVAIVASMNPSQGRPEALALIVPVPFAVHEEWAERTEDLMAVLAYRVVAAIGAALKSVGVPDAPIQYADYQGKLAIQVWLGDKAPQGDLREALVAEFDGLGELSSELQAVRLELHTAWLDPEVVTSGEDGDEVPDEDTASDLGTVDGDSGFGNSGTPVGQEV